MRTDVNANDVIVVVDPGYECLVSIYNCYRFKMKMGLVTGKGMGAHREASHDQGICYLDIGTTMGPRPVACKDEKMPPQAKSA
jgi:hypothetical protein